MVTSARAYLLLLLLVAAQRVVELVRSRRHERILRAQGAVEVGAGHYPAMVVMHALFLGSCAVEALRAKVPPPIAVAAGAMVVLVVAQVLRTWAIRTLGDRWTTRILILPGAPPVVRGPYRFVRHPNYLAVALEMAAVPLVYGAWRTALLFSLANACVLSVRIAAEERALGDTWAGAFRDRPRFVPWRSRDAA